MSKQLIVITVFIAALSSFILATAQTNEAGRAQPNALAKSDTSNKALNPKPTEKPSTSAEANAEAKRLYKIGVKYGRAGLFKQAVETFQKAVELDPNYADAHYGLGHAYLDLGRWPEAISSFQEALRIDPKDNEAYTKLGEAYAMRQRAMAVDQQAVAATNQPAIDEPAGTPGTLKVSKSRKEENAAAASPATEIDLTRLYRVGAGDVLDVRLPDSTTTSQSTLFTVTPSGFLEHPNFTEPVSVSGLTVEEISARLEADLKRRALNENPKVMVGVRDYVSHAILVSGLVKDPGTKILRREAIPLYVVVADAQPMAEAGRVTVVHRDSDEVVNVDILDPLQMNRLVHPGDVVTLQPNQVQFLYVGGEVKNPGERQYRRGLTLTQAILAAGGLTRASKEIELARDNGNGFLKLTRYKLKAINLGKEPDPLVQPGDRITVLH